MTEPARRQGGVMIDRTVVANDPSAPSSSMRFKAIFGGAFGNFIEWYDFAIYGFLAAILADQIFPRSDPSVSLLASFGAFAIPALDSQKLSNVASLRVLQSAFSPLLSALTASS